MCQKTSSLYIDTEHQSALSISSHCIEASSKLRIAQYKEQENNQKHCHNYTDFYIGIHIFPDSVYCSHSRNNHTSIFQRYKCFIFYVKWIRMYDRCHTTGEEHTCQRYDKWLNIKVSYQIALYNTKCKTNSDRNQK